MTTKTISKKVTPTKTVAKKTPLKRSVPVAKKAPAKAKQPTLVYAPDNSSFWVADGQILNSLKALHVAFGSMDAKTYAHHVTKDKNDFALWVEAVLHDKECAALLLQAKTKTAAKAVITARLKVYVP